MSTELPPTAEAGDRAPAADVPAGSLWSGLRDAIRGTNADYTKIPLRKAVFLLSVPMVLELVLESTFAVVDIYFVGKLGASAVATVGLTETFLFLLYAVAMGLAMAVTAVIARRIGEVRKVLAASPDYLGRRGTPQEPAELARHECLDFAGFRRVTSWDTVGEPAPARPRLSIDTAEPLVDAAIAGAGIVGLFSFHLAPAIRADSS